MKLNTQYNRKANDRPEIRRELTSGTSVLAEPESKPVSRTATAARVKRETISR